VGYGYCGSILLVLNTVGMKKIHSSIIVVVFLVFITFYPLSFTGYRLPFTKPAHAADYVLPYPSYMPGHVLYVPQKIVDQVQEWWYFGWIGQSIYHRELSDRYLVEADTLFRYNQHKLASEALALSNAHFLQELLTVDDLDSEGYDNGLQRLLLIKQAQAHADMLEHLDEILPKQITWEQEKKDAVVLPLGLLVRQSIIIRSYADHTK